MKEKRSKASPFYHQAGPPELYHFWRVRSRFRPKKGLTLKSRSQVVLQVFIPLSQIQVSVLGTKRPSGELFCKQFFRPSYYFHAYRYPFQAPKDLAANQFASGSSNLYATFMRVGIRSRHQKAKRRTISQVVLQVFVPLSGVQVSVLDTKGLAANHFASGSLNGFTTCTSNDTNAKKKVLAYKRTATGDKEGHHSMNKHDMAK